MSQETVRQGGSLDERGVERSYGISAFVLAFRAEMPAVFSGFPVTQKTVIIISFWETAHLPLP